MAAGHNPTVYELIGVSREDVANESTDFIEAMVLVYDLSEEQREKLTTERKKQRNADCTRGKRAREEERAANLDTACSVLGEQLAAKRQELEAANAKLAAYSGTLERLAPGVLMAHQYDPRRFGLSVKKGVCRPVLLYDLSVPNVPQQPEPNFPAPPPALGHEVGEAVKSLCSGSNTRK